MSLPINDLPYIKQSDVNKLIENVFYDEKDFVSDTYLKQFPFINWELFSSRNKIVVPSMTKADEKESELNQEPTEEIDKVGKI